MSATGPPVSKAACAASAKPPPPPPLPPAREGLGGGRRTSYGRAGERRQSQLRCGEPAAERKAAMVAEPPVVAARVPSRWSAVLSACTISARTSPALRKRTSALAG